MLRWNFGCKVLIRDWHLWKKKWGSRRGQRKKCNSDVGSTKNWSTCRIGLEQVLFIRVALFWAEMTVHLYHSLLILPIWATQRKSWPLERLLSAAEADHKSADCGGSLLTTFLKQSSPFCFEGDLGGIYPCLSHLD